jgi:hypothetical protein
VVLRYQDPQNYWSFTTLPTSLRSVVRLVQRGLVAREQYIPLAVAEVGSQMEVRFDGNWMDFRLNGRRVAGMYDPTLALSTGVGLIAGGPLALDTRFDDFYAVADD